MGLLGKLLKTTINIATLPVSMVKDVATMGGALTDKEQSYTNRKLKKINKDTAELMNEIDDL
jgi:hypothetical protein